MKIQDKDDGKKMLVIEVIDTGIGISETNQRKLFKLFGILDDKEGLNVNGIGLGLNISKNICQ